MDMGYVHGSMSSAELRKIRKPIIERRRRERINRCLDQIKSLVLKALNQDESKYEKMDKADILEMAVRHLLDNERSKMRGTYRSGYTRCTDQVKDFLNNNSSTGGGSSGADYADVQKRLLGHLQAPVPLPSPPAGIFRPQPVHPTPANFSVKTEAEDDDLHCSTVSSTSSCLPSLSPSVRQRRDSGLDDEFSPDKSSSSLPCSDIDSFEHASAFRKISASSSESATRAACLELAEYSLDSSDSDDSDIDTRPSESSPVPHQISAPATSPVWRPW